MTLLPDSKGNPKVISDTKGEDITPQNPEIVKQFPVDLTDKKAVDKVENATTVEPKK
jgi:hypothetical protein